MDNMWKIIKRTYNKVCLRFILRIQCRKTNIVRCGNEYGGFDVESSILNDIHHKRKLIVYSFGIGEDLSFSRDVYRRWNCEIHAFDPTPKSIEYVHESDMINLEGFYFHEYGLADKNGISQFFLPKNQFLVPSFLTGDERVEEVSGSLMEHREVQGAIPVEVKTLKTIMRQLGHRQIDLLKMDIEGAEFSVIKNILGETSEILFQELCLEIHNRFLKDGRSVLKNMVKRLNEAGYLIASVSSNLTEVTFIHRFSDNAS